MRSASNGLFFNFYLSSDLCIAIRLLLATAMTKAQYNSGLPFLRSMMTIIDSDIKMGGEYVLEANTDEPN